ncbi:hypothetical protein C7212DRAFT_364071 [Tuber magnatum]|uniref:CFEM domain-containing protein n=1 Tax=Tuber magnatum TaxID=42249 RepID=A0A317SR34_9PEZI|nr:hypothetical protein C7212DRAFT_364071 [Tuber magnatum]
MKISLIASILGAAVMVAAQSAGLSDLPACSMSCVSTAMGNVSGCGQADVPCLCKNAGFIGELTSCLPTACVSPEDVQKAVSVAQTLCGANLPSGAVSSVQGGATGNATSSSGGNATSSGGNATKTKEPTPTEDSGSGSASSSSTAEGSAAGLVPGGFVAAAIFAGLLAL